MAATKEEMQALIERESVMEFIWTRSWRDIPDTEIGLFDMANDRWGTIFRIYPPYYASKKTQLKLEAFYKTNLPEDSSVQFFSFASKNIEVFKEVYRRLHLNPSNIGNEDVLKELTENRIEWMDKYKKESVFASSGQDVRIRNFVNLVCITIPKKSEKGIEYSESEIINILSRVYTSLQDFSPSKFTQTEYIKVMRELLIPDEEIVDVQEDHVTYLNTQVVNINSVMVIEDESSSLGIGTSITKKEYEELLRAENIQIEEEKEDLDKKAGGGMFSIFKKEKSKKKVERKNYTQYHAKVLTTKMFPSHISLFEMLSFFVDFYGANIETEIPCQFFSSLTIFFANKEKLKSTVFQKTQWNLQQTSTLGDAARYFPKIVEREQESRAINQLLSKGDIPMPAMWSLILLDDSLKKVTQYSQRIQKNFLQKNWELQEESIIQHWIYLYSLPLQFEPFILDKTSRVNTLFASNCAAITPLMTGEHGFGAPILVYVDRSGQLAGFDIFSSPTNYNFIVVGSSGSGKSYMMADFVTNYLMSGAKIRIIDVGKSYKELNQVLKGQYIEFTDDANICLNFFTKVKVNDKNEIEDEEMQNIIPLIGLMVMQSLSSQDDSSLDTAVLKGILNQAVSLAWEDRRRHAGMEDVMIALQKLMQEKKEAGENVQEIERIVNALNPFGSPDGPYYKYFNGENNLSFNNDFVVLELENIDTDDHLKSVILASIATTINSEFFLDSREQKKILIVDEAWSIMDNKIIVRFLETMARRIRKHNGGLGIITQTIGDFYKNSATKAIFDSAANKIFLKQDAEAIAAAEEAGELNLDPATIQLMKTLKSKPPLFSEALIKQSSGDFFIGRLMTDRLAHWIYTNHPSDMEVIYGLMKKYSISQLDAKIIKGYSEKNNSSIDEEFQKRLRSGLLIGV